MRYYIPYGYNALSGEAQIVDPVDVASAMEHYVFDEHLRKRHSVKGQELTTTYTWEKCLAPLVKRLSELSESD